jgi:hypothetical protein
VVVLSRARSAALPAGATCFQGEPCLLSHVHQLDRASANLGETASQDDKFEVLHARIPFATSDTVSAGRTGTRDIVALDCEMVSPTCFSWRL